MPNYEVTINRTRTIEDSTTVVVTAKDEESAQNKAESLVQKDAENRQSKFEWETTSEDSEYEFEAVEE